VARKAAAPRWSTNDSSSLFARFFPSLKRAESWLGQTSPYCRAPRIPVQGSKTGRRPEAPFTSGASAIGHAIENVHAIPPGTAYFSSGRPGNGFVGGNTPAVSTTGRCKRFGRSFRLRCALALRGKMAEPANPAPAVATLLRNERRSLEYGASW